jgi:hypothetical protein
MARLPVGSSGVAEREAGARAGDESGCREQKSMTRSASA